MQRSRSYEEFGDAEAKYERRPSVWIEPQGDWGAGAVELVEIPTDREINDNIVAYWRPKKDVPKGGPWRVSYRMRWTDSGFRHRSFSTLRRAAPASASMASGGSS